MKVKSIDKLDKISGNAVVYLTALVTYTDGVKDYPVQVTGEAINPYNRTDTEVATFIKDSLKSAIANQATALDEKVMESTKMDTLKATILSDLTKAGLTVLLAFMLWLSPTVGWAGDLYPEPAPTVTCGADASTAVSGFTKVVGAWTPLGTLSGATNYWVAVWANFLEGGDNPSGAAGVSVYNIENPLAGVTGYSPMSAVDITAVEYGYSKSITAGVGVTKFLGTFELVKGLGFTGAQNNTADNFGIAIRYLVGRGKY